MSTRTQKTLRSEKNNASYFLQGSRRNATEEDQMDNVKKKILQSTSTYPKSAVLKPFSSDFYQRTSFEDGACEEIKENCGCFHQGTSPNSHNPKKGDKKFMSPTVSAASKAAFPRKKILGERSESFGSNISETQMEKCPKNSPDLLTLSSQITPSTLKASESGGNGSDSISTYLPYDPLTNYLSPRPKFLRYKPNRRLEKLTQRESKMKSGEEENCCCRMQPQKSVAEKILTGGSSQDRTEEQERSNSKLELKPFHNQEVKESEESDDDDDDDLYDEEKEERSWHCSLVLKSFLLIGVLFFATFYISSSNCSAAPPHLKSFQSSREKYSTIQEPLFQFPENVPLDVNKILETIEQFSNTNGGNQINGNPLVLDNHIDSIEEELRVMKTENAANDLYEAGNREEDDALFGRTEQEQANEQSSMEVTGTAAHEGSKEEKVGEQGIAETREATEILTVQGGDTTEISVPLHASLTQLLLDTFAHENSCSTSETELLEVIETVSDEGNGRVEIAEESEKCDSIFEISQQGRIKPNFAESLQDSTIKSALESVAPDTSIASEIKLNSGKENVSLLGYMKNSFNSRAAIILSLISFLASFMALALFRLKGRKAPANVSSSKSSILENNNPSFPEKGQVLEKGSLSCPGKEQALENGDSCANPSSLAQPNDNYDDIHGTHPPAVKLLAEFAYGEISFPEKSSNRRLEVGTDERKCSQSQEIKSSTRKSLPSSTENPTASGFSTAELPSYGRSFTSQEKLTRKEESNDREEGMNPNAAIRNRKGEIVTPVRRSSRIRNLAMSP